MRIAIILFVLSFFTVKPLHCSQKQGDNVTYHYYCTVADEVHFPLLLNLIGSIHKVDFDNLDQIAVFDIGLNSAQKATLGAIEKVRVYDIEKTHPNICSYFTTNASGKQVRGWYAWKPVAIKQTLDMFPYVLYLDAGSLVLTSPNALFQHIQQNGYFFLDTPRHCIADRITKPVLEKVIPQFSKEQQDRILSRDTYIIVAGVQGVSKNIYENYILPLYRHSFDLTLFADDGTSKMGFGAARHDQTLFSIYAYGLNLKIHPQGWSQLLINGNPVPFHYHWNAAEVNDQTCIYSCRWGFSHSKDKRAAIHWKNKNIFSFARLF